MPINTERHLFEMFHVRLKEENYRYFNLFNVNYKSKNKDLFENVNEYRKIGRKHKLVIDALGRRSLMFVVLKYL